MPTTRSSTLSDNLLEIPHPGLLQDQGATIDQLLNNLSTDLKKYFFRKLEEQNENMNDAMEANHKSLCKVLDRVRHGMTVFQSKV